MRKYSDKLIKKACKLKEEGMPLQKIAAELGFESITPIRFHCGERDKFYSYFKSWRDRNREKWNAMTRKSLKRMRQNA